jgi:hypothetical protein
MKWMALVLILVAVAAGLVADAAPAWAQAEVRAGFAGAVASYDGAWLTLTIQQAEVRETSTVRLRMTQTTQVSGTLVQGARVAALAQLTSAEWVAVYVGAIPASPQVTPTTGLVTGVANGVATLLLPNNAVRTFQLSGGGASPSVGELVTVFARTRAGAAPDEPPQVAAIQTALQTRSRLEQQLQQVLRSDANLPASVLQNRAQVLERLAVRLEEHSQLQFQLLRQYCDRVCENAAYPLETRDVIKAHFQRVSDEQVQVADQVRQARNAAGGPGSTPVTPSSSGDQGGGGSGGQPGGPR